jgi:hypothetical protein
MPCQCTPDQLCLFHYHALDPGRQAAAAARLASTSLYVAAGGRRV